jgi:hypothetical protein
MVPRPASRAIAGTVARVVTTSILRESMSH